MEQLFYIFCTTLPGHVLPLALLWHFPWRSRRTALVLVLCNVLCKTAAAATCIANGISFRGLEILFSFLGFVIYLCSVSYTHLRAHETKAPFLSSRRTTCC